MYKVTVVIPCYQGEETIGRAVRSVLDTPRRREIEIVVVDDCSRDNTRGVVEELQRGNPNVKLYSMPQNSGSPSGPRNLGIERAQGEYVTFLDDDDTFDANRLMRMVDYALEEQADFLKGYLMVVNNGVMQVYNRLPAVPETTLDAIKAIVAYHSTNSDFLVRRDVLMDYGLRYDPGLKIGEDTVFTVEILVHAQTVRYMDEFFMYHINAALDVSNVSSTQRCGDKEINDQISAWQRTQQILSAIGVDYYKLRLHVGLRNLLLSIVRYGENISENAYARLCYFARETQQELRGKMNLHPRYQELYDAILADNYGDFLRQAKTRLLINGYDLKFILPVIPYLEDKYLIQVDEWTGHNAHDEKKSRQMAGWADVIWCEWMLGNAVYYTKKKNSNQRLVIRAHRFEITREFGFQIDFEKVNMVITVGYYYFEAFAAQFSIPREKMRLLSNYVEDAIYSTEKTEEAVYHVGLVGILPARKGFHRGLELIEKLREGDSRFRLYIMGKAPQEVPWIKNNPQEAAYFEGCEGYIREHGLEDAVVYGGFVPRDALYNDIGFVLSLSDDEVPESFHLSPAEGACAGSVGLLLGWPGVEYIYPPEYVCRDLDDMASRIRQAVEDPSEFTRQANGLRDYVLEHYGMDRFLTALERYLKQLYILE